MIVPPLWMPVGSVPAPGFGAACACQSFRVLVSLFAGLRSMELPAGTAGTAGLNAAVDPRYDTASTLLPRESRRNTPSPGDTFRPEPILPSATS